MVEWGAPEKVFLGNNHSNRDAQCLVRKYVGRQTILIAVATPPLPASQHKQTNVSAQKRVLFHTFNTDPLVIYWDG